MKYKIYYQKNNKINILNLEALNTKMLLNNKSYPENIIYVKELNNTNNLFFINENEKLELFYELKTMLDANLEIKYIIDILLQGDFNKQNKIFLKDISIAIENGQNIYDSIVHHKTYIGNSIIFFKISQKTSNLKASISAMYEMIKIQKEIKNNILEVLTYPIILLFSIIFTIVILFIYVIPKFENIYLQLGSNLPYSTELLLNIKYYITNQYILLIVILFIILNIFKVLSNIFIYEKDKIILNYIPIFSQIYKNIIFYKLFLSVSLQINSKESFYNALQNSEGIVSNIYFKSKLLYILKDIKNGKSIHYSFKKTNMFDLFTLRLLHTAQITNQYEDILKNIVNIYKINIQKDINKFKIYYQPLLIFIISSIILWLVLAVMSPIWDLGSIIK
jgi:general secretion pathway protein F